MNRIAAVSIEYLILSTVLITIGFYVAYEAYTRLSYVYRRATLEEYMTKMAANTALIRLPIRHEASPGVWLYWKIARTERGYFYVAAYLLDKTTFELTPLQVEFMVPDEGWKSPPIASPSIRVDEMTLSDATVHIPELMTVRLPSFRLYIVYSSEGTFIMRALIPEGAEGEVHIMLILLVEGGEVRIYEEDILTSW
ncbi:MAG: hypothetical protein DRN15_01485 [Thermoprotei archaeon]|nr:MAG: hypothetical protein DRN15_01485 [Thermoprotei archaeon]RLF25866.1 MAG: hypothetical protein DRM97_00380 [Thermoprotei archaeon]